MKAAACLQWREFAWNGIRFSAPEKWETGKIGSRYLLLEQEARPMMEIKWGRISGKFSHHRHLRRLAGLRPDKRKVELAECPLPPGWKAALANFKATGFHWTGEPFQGMGAILYCPACKNAALIQFYRHDRADAASFAHRVLASFQDHTTGEQVLWSIFDIRARLPASFWLTSFRFDAGHFFLKFSRRRQVLTLSRWGPASILLSDDDKGLLSLARTFYQISEADVALRLSDHGRAIDGATTTTGRRWFPRLNLLNSARAFQRFRVWHLPDKNRILGMRIESNTPFDPDAFGQLCAGYECF